MIYRASITRRGLLRGMGVAALAGGLAGCGTQGAASTAEGLAPLTFVLDYTPNTNHTGIYVAQEKGYYADEGIELTIVQPPDDGADALVGTGQAQLGMGFQDVMANYLGSSDPFPVTAIAAIIQHNTSGIMSTKGLGADHPAGLAGLRYGTWDQDVEQAMVRTVVEADGGNWDDVRLVSSSTTDEVSGLRAGLFDATWVYEGWAGQNAILQDYPVDYFAFADLDPRFDFYTPVIIANNAWLEAEPELAAGFLAATAQGYADAIADPDEAVDILVAASPEIDEDLARASQRFLADKYIDDAPAWGVIDRQRWDSFYQWLNEEGLVEVPIESGVGFTNEYLPSQG